MAKPSTSENKFAAAHAALNAFLDKGSAFEGKLTFQGAVRIDGKFTGQIMSDDTMLVGEQGRIYGQVIVGDADIGGLIEGTLTVLGVVHFRGSAKFKGELNASRLIVDDGAVINGTINMVMPDVAQQAKAIHDEVEKTLF